MTDMIVANSDENGQPTVDPIGPATPRLDLLQTRSEHLVAGNEAIETEVAAPIIVKPSSNQTTAPKTAVVDALAKWDAETPRATSNLGEVRIDANDRILIPFTTSVAEVDLHYVDFSSLQGYLRCNGKGCLLCGIGRRVDKRDLLPIFDAVDRRVGVLSISPSIRPGALQPQIQQVLKRLHDERLLTIISRPDRGQYIVTPQKLAKGVDDGAAQIAAFLREFAEGLVDLASVFPAMSNEELAAVPEIAMTMRVRGICL